MRIFSTFLLGILLLAATGWETDLDTAKEKAKKQDKYILLNFSGSDWCIPCIRMHKNIFESPDFTAYADSNLILVNADFPRLKKNGLSKDQQKKNDKLAEKYNPEGNFPLTLLMDKEGKVIKSWVGYPSLTAAAFTAQVKSAIDAR
ncbi:MAG: thioredoxin family protein [Chitinophagaceae bacterium]|nr:thioredoxin family protein [Chitinophagaceae bacterium]